MKIKTLVLLCGASVFFMPLAYADLPAASKNPSSIAVPPTVVDSSSVIHMVLGLMVVVALIFLCAYFVRRLNGVTITDRHLMKVVAVLPLGVREKVVLIEVGKQQILLGLAPGNITTLHVLTEPVDVAPAGVANSDFVRKLQSILNRETAS